MADIELIDETTLARLNALARDPSADAWRRLEEVELSAIAAVQALSDRERHASGDGYAVMANRRNSLRTLSECEQVFTEDSLGIAVHPASLAAACVSLLYRLDTRYRVLREPPYAERDEPARYSRAAILSRLGRLLLDYPVFMAPRIGFWVTGASTDVQRNPRPERVPMACALAYVRFCALPSVEFGYDQADLATFAALPCVRAGLTSAARMGSDRLTSVASFMSMTPTDIIKSGALGLHKAPFVASLLSLNALAERSGAAPLVRPVDSPSPADKMSASAVPAEQLHKCMAAFLWEFAVMGDELIKVSGSLRPEALFRVGRGIDSTVEQPPGQPGCYAPFVEPASQQAIKVAFARGIEKAFFGQAPKLEGQVGGEYCTMLTGVKRTVRVLQDSELVASSVDAARLLFDAALGNDSLRGQHQLPECSIDRALGFFDGLAESGLRVPDALPVLGWYQTRDDNDAHTRELVDAWSAAHHAHLAKASMNRVLEEAAAVAPPVAIANRRRQPL